MEKQKIENWKVLRSEYIAKEPWFTARRDEVQLPNGNVIPFLLCIGISGLDLCDRSY